VGWLSGSGRVQFRMLGSADRLAFHAGSRLLRSFAAEAAL
jgi:hypothetical protein